MNYPPCGCSCEVSEAEKEGSCQGCLVLIIIGWLFIRKEHGVKEWKKWSRINKEKNLALIYTAGVLELSTTTFLRDMMAIILCSEIPITRIGCRRDR